MNTGIILVCKIEDRQGEVQWTKDGFGLDVTRDLTGYPRYRMIGSDSQGNKILFSKALISALIVKSVQGSTV